MAIQLEQLKKVLNRKHLSDFSLRQIFTDIGLYEDILIDCIPTKTSLIYLSENEYGDELEVSDDVYSFNELWSSKSPILLSCPSCGKNELTFNLKRAYKPKEVNEPKTGMVRTNGFSEDNKYNIGVNGLGIIDNSSDIRENWDDYCRERADDCKRTILAIKDFRKEANCSLEYDHRYIVDFIIIDPKIDYNDLPENIQDVLYSEEKSDQEQEYIDAFNTLKHCLILRKIGQSPSQAEAQLLDTSKYRKILGDKYKDYTLSSQLYASGVGAGALVYLRRIFESLLEESHKRCIESENWDEEKYKMAHIEEKIKIVEDRDEVLIPKELEEIRKKFYGALSKGIHELSENECKELFPAFRFVIDNILDARIAKIEHEKKRNEMMKLIKGVKS